MSHLTNLGQPFKKKGGIEMKEKYDVIVIGMGPSSIFLAYELIQLGKNKRILLI